MKYALFGPMQVFKDDLFLRTIKVTFIKELPLLIFLNQVNRSKKITDTT